MKTIVLKHQVKGLPYKPGDAVPVYSGRTGLIWHLWNKTVRIPETAYDTIRTGGNQRYTDLGIAALRRMAKRRTCGFCKTDELNKQELIEELEAFDRGYYAKYGRLPSFNYGG